MREKVKSRADSELALRETGEVVPGLVSVIVPIFNRKAMLRDAIACVDAQTYRPIELILVDDGSTDGTAALCDEIASGRPGEVRAFHQSNGGPGLAREAGRRLARGQYIQYLDSDDWLHPRKLERQVATLEANSDAGVCYCITCETGDAVPGERQVTMRTAERLDTIFPAFLMGRLWQTVTPLWRRSASDRIGPWTDLRVEEDLEYDARAGGLGIRPVWCPETLAEHRHHAGPRAGTGDVCDAAKMKDRAASHRLVLAHARAAGVDERLDEMQHYSRELLFLGRQCASLGLAGEATALVRLGRDAAGRGLRSRPGTLAFLAVAHVFGWTTAGRLSSVVDRIRRRY